MATETAAPFVWGEGGGQLTPSQISARRQLAQAMMAQGMDYSPIRSPWQGAARVAQSLLGTADSMSADKDEKEAQRAAIAGALEVLGGGGSATAAATGTTSSAPIAAPATRSIAPVADTSEKIYSNDEPSPLDPPSGADRDMAIRTIIAESGNQPFAGQTGVAAVMRNRAVDGSYGGDTLPGVIQKPYAFEPWNTPGGRDKMAAIPASDPRYATAGRALDAAYFGEDPTEGATHFVAPKAQAALGRPMPGWAQGDSTTIGDHVFYSPDDAGTPAPVRTASATAFAPAGTPEPPAVEAASGLARGVQAPSGGMPGPSPAVQTVAQAMPASVAAGPAAAPRPGVEAIARVMANPFTPPALAKAVADRMAPKESYAQETDAQGNIWNVNRTTGQRTVALKKDANFGQPYRDDDGNLVQRGSDGKISVVSAAEKTPTSVAEYNFYKKNFAPTEHTKEPMGYDAWSTAKARAAAININNTNNTGGGSDKQIFDEFAERSKLARSTATGLVALRDARTALQGDGGAITGFRANERLALQKAGAYLGVTEPASIQNTETFRAAIAPQVASVLKSTVGTANISNSDREFAEKAAGGSITLDEGSIKRLLDIMEKASVAQLQQHQEQLDVVYPDPVANKRERALFGIKVPTAAAPPAGATKSGIKWSVE